MQITYKHFTLIMSQISTLAFSDVFSKEALDNASEDHSLLSPAHASFQFYDISAREHIAILN